MQVAKGKKIRRPSRALVVASAAAAAAVLIHGGQSVYAQAFTFTSESLTYTENFDSMGTSTTAFPTGWTSTDTAMVVSNGGSNTGSSYNFGTTGSGDRALGSVASGSVQAIIGASFLNGTGSSITQIDFSGFMEQWRSGSSSAANEVLPFEFSLDATNLTTGTWTALTSMDLVEKLTATTTAAAVDGNDSANRTSISGSALSLSWTSGGTLWIRWRDADNTGSDGGYAIDDFNMTVTAAPPSAVLYFDPDGSSAGTGGSGAWDTTTSNWSTSPAGDVATTTYTGAETAAFEGTGGSVAVAVGGITVNAAININADGYNFSGGTITLGTSNPISVTTGASATISSAIDGASGLTKIGDGTLILSGTNLYTEGTNINGGTLAVASDVNLGAVSGAVVLGGGTLQADDTFATDAARNISGTGAIDVTGSNALTVQGNATFGTLTLPGTGTLVLAGTANSATTLNFTNTGTLSIAGGAMALSAVNGSPGTGQPATISGDITIAGGTLVLAPEVDTVLELTGNVLGSTAGTSSSSSVLHANGGDGTVVLSGTSSTYRTLRIGTASTSLAASTSGGTIEFTDVGALGEINPPTTTQTLQLNYGKLVNGTGGSAVIAKNLSLGAVDVTLAGGAMTFDGNLTNSFFRPAGGNYQAQLTIETDVTLEDAFDAGSGSGTFTGITIKGGGTLTLNGATNTIGANNENITVSSATLAVNGAMTSVSSLAVTSGGTLKGAGTIAGIVTADGGTVAAGNNIGTLTVGGVDLQAGTLQVELQGSGSGDTLIVTGTALLEGAALNGTATGAFTNGQVFTIVDGLAGSTSGTFAGLAENSQVLLSGQAFTISYLADGGGDVTLTAVPEPASLSLLALGGMGLLRRRRRLTA